ncbi:hypothetical protein RND81_01G073600 [Saponaria officinalis]|uniref:Polygalacturonase n=1 Tax=Saponaria officinalis TaxID=3572 RepID=A0AAW1NEY1_SAPOF
MKATNFVFLFFLALFNIQGESATKVFNLKDYGAIPGGQVDNSKALLKAWGDACNSHGGSTLEVPSATYLVYPVTLSGPCKGPMLFHNIGILKGPSGLQGNSWVSFQYINGLTLTGGTFDGQGSPKQTTPNLPALLSFDFMTNSRAQCVTLINSRNTHFQIFACNQIDIDNITISSPGDSVNTDGIKIGNSNSITITNTNIGCGDDCVAVLPNSKDINVTGVTCGPGHGISIGSMGGSANERVEHVTVTNCIISNTLNGLRIKSKTTNMPGLVNNVRYENISFQNVDNPIIIDQNYCPSRTCHQGDSRVQIQNVEFINVHGTSVTPVAVNLQCSGTNPCTGIDLNDINIPYFKQGATTISKCLNARGRSSGVQIPKSCI